MLGNWSLKKKSGLDEIKTHDLCDTCALLYQLSYQANWELLMLWVHNYTRQVLRWWRMQVNICKVNDIKNTIYTKKISTFEIIFLFNVWILWTPIFLLRACITSKYMYSCTCLHICCWFATVNLAYQVLSYLIFMHAQAINKHINYCFVSVWEKAGRTNFKNRRMKVVL